MEITGHPAPGLGIMMPGWFSIPENPISMAESGVRYHPHMSELLESQFRIDQNPLIARARGVAGCSTTNPVRMEGSQVVPNVTNGMDEMPIWTHIALGGLVAAIAIAAIVQRKK